MLVGRGATKQPLSAVASSHREVFHLDPPLYLPPTRQVNMPTTSNSSTRVNIPFYSPPPPVPTFLPPNAQEGTPPSETEAYMTMPDEGKEEYKQMLASLRLSEKIHVLGITPQAKYLTHCLAGTPNLPAPQLLTRDQGINKWGAEGRRISLRRGDGFVVRHEVPMPQYAGPPRNTWQRSLQARLKPIDNLIMCTSEAAFIPSLLNLRDRINENTTICLIHAGLGMAERLCEEIFPDPTTRPTFVLGHMSHWIVRDPRSTEEMYSVHVKTEGKLYLSGMPLEQPAGPEAHTWDRIVRHARTQHLIKVLSQVPGLHATSRPFGKFLRHKLPSLVFSALADSISVALGCRYDRIYRDTSAKRMWDKLWDETIEIISALPELQHAPVVASYFQGKTFRAETERLLRAYHGMSPWIALIRQGKGLPIQYVNGYLIKRALELGIRCPNHRMVMNMVRSKYNAKQEELKTAIPLYYLEGDSLPIEEGQPPPTTRIVYVDK